MDREIIYILTYEKKKEEGIIERESRQRRVCVRACVFFFISKKTQRTVYSAILIPKKSHFTPFRERKD